MITILLGLLVLFAFCIAGMLWYLNQNLAHIANTLNRIVDRREDTGGLPPKMPQYLKEP